MTQNDAKSFVYRLRGEDVMDGKKEGYLTVKQAAELWGMSERSVSMVRAIDRIRPDLAQQAVDGRISVHMAWKVANGRITAPDRSTTWTGLIYAWNRAREDEKERFLKMLGIELVD
jgi:hypothetical protein